MTELYQVHKILMQMRLCLSKRVFKSDLQMSEFSFQSDLHSADTMNSVPCRFLGVIAKIRNVTYYLRVYICPWGPGVA